MEGGQRDVDVVVKRDVQTWIVDQADKRGAY